MSMSDPLADMLTRIRNAGMAKLESVDIPLSYLKLELAKILAEEGYIKDIKVIKENTLGILRLFFYIGKDGKSSITGLRRVSRPGRRYYVKADDIPKVLSGMGVAILSTSRGLLADKQARTLRVGGELLCEVW